MVIDGISARHHWHVSRRKRSIKSRVTGPGLPLPIVRLSTLTTGMTSAAVPVRKHSSAM